MLAREDPTASYRLLADELCARGYTTREFRLGESHVFETVSSRGRRWLTTITHISYPMQTAFFKRISIRKELAYELLRDAGIPVPFTRVVKLGERLQKEESEQLLARFSRLIVKPADSSLSRGLTLNITNTMELMKAIEIARKYASSGAVLIQNQVTGEELRFVYLNGNVIAALLRETAKVVGDGIASVQQLIDAENTARSQITGSMVPYPQLTSEVIDKGIDTNHIPAIGEVIELNRLTMIRGGASIYNVIEAVHETYISLVKQAADAVGTGFVVVDMMIDDYTTPYDGKNAFFNEFNSAPVLKLFYSCRDGKHFDIVPKLVDAIDKRIHV